MPANSFFPEGSEQIKIHGILTVGHREPFWQSALDKFLVGNPPPDGYQVNIKSVPPSVNIMPVSRSIVLDGGPEDESEVVFNGVGIFTFGDIEDNKRTIERKGISTNETFAAYQEAAVATTFGAREVAPWGTAVVAKDGTVVHLMRPELLGAFNVETLTEKIESTEYVEEVVRSNGLRIAIPHFVAASVYGSDEVKVAGGVYVRPKVLTDVMILERGVSRSAIMTLRHTHYRAIRDLMDAHVLNPQLHFGNRGWVIQGDQMIAYLADWEDMMNTIDYDTQTLVPLELQGFMDVSVTPLEKARIFALTKAIGQDIANVMVKPEKIKDWENFIGNDIVLAVASGFYRERDLNIVKDRLAKEIKAAELELGVSYKNLLTRFATSLKGLSTGSAKIMAGNIGSYYALHRMFESELATFLAYIMVKSAEKEVPKKKRKRR